MKKLLLKAFVMLCLLASTGYANTYYVSSSGNDSNGGSESSPFKTIAKAASVVNAGDMVLISAGTYTEKSITPKSSGSEGKYVVFKPKPGTGDVIVKHPGTSPTETTPIFQLSSKSYIWIEGLVFKGFKYGLACIYMNNSTANVVINNRFEDLGNSQVANWNGNQMVGVYNSTKCVMTNNYFKNIIGDGININSQKSEYNLVCYNTFINFDGKLRSWGGSSLFSRAVDMQDMSTGNNVTAFNYAEDVVHHVWLDRDGSTNIILRNYGNGGSGNVFNESRCASNVIQENISVSMKVGYMSAYYSTTSDTYDPHIINNICYNNQIGFRIHKSHRDKIRNNICFNNTNLNIEFSSTAAGNGPHVFKNNLWYTSSKTNSVSYSGSAMSVSNFQTKAGETNGLSADPKFTSTAGAAEGFALQSSSPAKGAADNGLDLGAFAYYGPSLFGRDNSFTPMDVSVYFDATTSRAERGKTHTLTLRLSKASSSTVTVDIVAIAGDAVIGNDFMLIGGETVTFSPGETSKNITLQIGGQGTYDELVALKLTNATNASVGPRCIHAVRFSPGSAAIFPTVTITAPSANITTEAPANITVEATVTNPDGTVSGMSFYANNTLIGSDNSSPYSVIWNETATGTYAITAKATMNGKEYTSASRTVTINPPQAPYNGTAWAIPGKIEFEHFDVGGNQKAYSDDSDGNTGGTDFRTDQDVDIETCTDEGEGYNIGYFTDGEWLEYTVNVEFTGTFDLIIRAAVNGDGRTVSLSYEDGTSIASTIDIPTTSGWQEWVDVRFQGIEMEAGEHVLRFTMGATDYVNLNYMEFVSVSDVPTVSIDSPLEASVFNTSETIEIKATALSAQSNISTVTFYANGELIGSASTPPYAFSWTGMDSGDYSLTAVATDANNVSANSAVVGITVNSGAQSVALTKGWNLVGYPFIESKTVESAFSGIWDSFLVIKDFDGFYDISNNPALKSLSEVEFGKGYFVKVSEACVLTW